MGELRVDTVIVLKVRAYSSYCGSGERGAYNTYCDSVDSESLLQLLW